MMTLTRAGVLTLVGLGTIGVVPREAGGQRTSTTPTSALVGTVTPLISIRANWISQSGASDDGVLGGSDEIYVVFATANLASPVTDPDPVRVWMSGEYTNWDSPPAVRPIGKNLWGLSGSPSPIGEQKDVAILGLVLEADSDPFHSFPSDVDKALTARLIELKNNRTTLENMPYALQLTMFHTTLTKSPHRPIGGPKIVKFPDFALSYVKGEVGRYKIAYELWGERETGEGKYQIEFEIRRDR